MVDCSNVTLYPTFFSQASCSLGTFFGGQVLAGFILGFALIFTLIIALAIVFKAFDIDFGPMTSFAGFGAGIIIDVAVGWFPFWIPVFIAAIILFAFLFGSTIRRGE